MTSWREEEEKGPARAGVRGWMGRAPGLTADHGGRDLG